MKHHLQHLTHMLQESGKLSMNNIHVIFDLLEEIDEDKMVAVMKSLCEKLGDARCVRSLNGAIRLIDKYGIDYGNIFSTDIIQSMQTAKSRLAEVVNLHGAIHGGDYDEELMNSLKNTAGPFFDQIDILSDSLTLTSRLLVSLNTIHERASASNDAYLTSVFPKVLISLGIDAEYIDHLYPKA